MSKPLPYPKLYSKDDNYETLEKKKSILETIDSDEAWRLWNTNFPGSIDELAFRVRHGKRWDTRKAIEKLMSEKVRPHGSSTMRMESGSRPSMPDEEIFVKIYNAIEVQNTILSEIAQSQKERVELLRQSLPKPRDGPIKDPEPMAGVLRTLP